MTVYVFAGQGAQRKNMGGSLFDEFEEMTEAADAVLGYSIRELCLEDPRRELDRTQFTQPAMYVVNALSYLKKLRDDAGRPDALVGHSLGEYDALFAAGVFSFETGLHLVKKRGELIAQCGAGSMAAVVGLRREHVERVLNEQHLDTLDLANDNSPLQVVIAGPRQDITRAQPLFEAAGATAWILLNVSGPFHSRYMKPAADAFDRFLDEVRFSPPRIPVVSNVHARFYRVDEIRDSLVTQITATVRWTESIQFLIAGGETNFEEVGGTGVMLGLIRKIQNETPPAQVPAAVAPVVAPAAVEAPAAAAAPAAGVAPAPAGVSVAVPSPDMGMHGDGTRLGSQAFRDDHRVRYAFVASPPQPGIASPELAIRMARAGFLSYFGVEGLELPAIEAAIRAIRAALADGQTFGLKLSFARSWPAREDDLVRLYLRHDVPCVEVSGYLEPTVALVHYRAKGLRRGPDGNVIRRHRILARVFRPEVAEWMLGPAPESLLRRLVEKEEITPAEAALAASVPLVDDLCADASGGSSTSWCSPLPLLPALVDVRDQTAARFRPAGQVRVGLSGGIGTPSAVAAAFALAADFIVTGAIHQCTVESGLSPAAKDLLAQMDVHDTDRVPASDFDAGDTMCVLKRGVLFPPRARKLFELYQQHDSLDAIDPATRIHLQERYFRRSFEDVYREVRGHLSATRPDTVERAERDPRYKMALIFGWYLRRGAELAAKPEETRTADLQIHCGPALGAFNRHVRGTPLADWRNRHADEISTLLMDVAADRI